MNMQTLLLLLGHHLWQASALVLLTFVLVRKARSRNGATRYGIWSLALMAAFLMPALMLIPRATPTRGIEQPFSDTPSLRGTVAVEPASIPQRGTQVSLPAAPTQTKRPQIPVTGLLLALWLCVALWKLSGIGHALVSIAALQRKAKPWSPSHPLATWLASQPLKPNIKSSADIVSPMAIGIFRPVVLLPDTFSEQFEEEEMKQIILHELAHIKRRDYAANLVQKLGESLFWYHPGVKWAAREMDVEREIACDEWAASRTGKPKAFAGCLLKAHQTIRDAGSLTPLAVGVVRSKGQLSRRIDNLLTRRAPGFVASKSLLALTFLLLMVSGVGLTLATPALFALPPEPGVPLPATTGDEGEDQRGSMTHKTNKVHMTIKGKMTLNRDETEILKLSRNGLFSYEERTGGRHKIKVVPDGRGLTYRYWVNGEERDFDSEGRQWLHENLPTIMAQSGVFAQRRMQRIIEDRGMDGALDWYDGLEADLGDYARSAYLRGMLGSSELKASHTSWAISKTTAIKSDYEKSRIFRTLLEDEVDSTVLEELAEGLSGIDSDYELSRTLRAALASKSLTKRTMTALFRAADSLESSYEASRFLRAVADSWPMAELVEMGYLDLATDIESDYEKARVLSRLIELDDLDSKTVDTIISHAGDSINSSYELGRFLKKAAPKADSVDVFVKASRSVDSAYERARALNAILEHMNLNDDQLARVIEATDDMGGGHELFKVLREVLANFELGEASQVAFESAMGQLSRDDQKRLRKHR